MQKVINLVLALALVVVGVVAFGGEKEGGLGGSSFFDPVDIFGAKRITFQFTRAAHSAGSSAFKVQVSLDGDTFVDFNGLVEDLTNTNAQTKTRVTSVTLAADGSKVASMDLQHHHFKKMRVVATETTDGTHTAKALIER